MFKKGELFKGIFIIVAILVLISINSFFVNAGNREILKKCSVLDTPDKIYYLTQDITQENNESCIIMKTENITLDCKGYSIINSNNSQASGIFSDIKKTNIKNCVIEGFEKGIFLNNSDGSMIINNLITKNKVGISMESSANVIISLNRVIKNEKGISFGGENGVISNNEFCFNIDKDVSCDSNQLFENNHCDSGEVCGGECFPCTYNDHEVYNCRELNKANTIYELRTNINLYVPETCFIISSDNITLNGNRNSLNYMLRSPSSGEFSIYSEKNNLTIKNIEFKGTSLDYRYNGEAINFVNSSNTNILNNSFESIKNAIFFQGLSERGDISWNNLKNLNGDGIYLENSNNTLIKQNQIEEIIGNGIYIEKGSENLVKGNKLLSIKSKSIRIGKGDNSQITDNYIESSGKESIELMNSKGIIENNNILNMGSTGIILANSSGAVIKNNNLEKGSGYGINFVSVSETLVRDNNIYLTKGGILAEKSSNVEIIENNVGSSYFGFKEDSSSGLSLSNNTFCGNDHDVLCSSNNIFKSNYCNSGNICGGDCIECGRYKKSLWVKIKEFFKNIFN